MKPVDVSETMEQRMKGMVQIRDCTQELIDYQLDEYPEDIVKIALAGNPNSGKTTLFNALTGSNQFVGNWPGVTVEKKEGKLKNHKDNMK